MSERMRVIQYGLSPIGSAVARQVVERAALALVQGVDVDPTMVGKDVEEAIGLGRCLGFPAVEERGKQRSRRNPTLCSTPRAPTFDSSEARSSRSRKWG
jgi:hypothetical protein